MHRKVVSFSIDEDTHKKLKELCSETERQTSWVIKTALTHYFNELEDYDIALTRLMDSSDKIISSSELRRELGLQDRLQKQRIKRLKKIA